MLRSSWAGVGCGTIERNSNASLSETYNAKKKQWDSATTSTSLETNPRSSPIAVFGAASAILSIRCDSKPQTCIGATSILSWPMIRRRWMSHVAAPVKSACAASGFVVIPYIGSCLSASSSDGGLSVLNTLYRRFDHDSNRHGYFDSSCYLANESPHDVRHHNTYQVRFL